jgi:hypothetical protein
LNIKPLRFILNHRARQLRSIQTKAETNMKPTFTTQQIAAFKAWETIRANQRSARAHKAWETIRANRRRAARRAAALKAWDTMRAEAAYRSDVALRAWDTRDLREAA